MAAPILSTLWYRVAGLKPKLRSHVRLCRHRYRGKVWYLLQDKASGRVSRFTPAARLAISLMDGAHSVAGLWEIANRRLGEAAPTQDEMIQLLGQLHAADLLQSDVPPDVVELSGRGDRDQKDRKRRSFGNPLAIRVSLWDPDAFLNRFAGLIALIWSRFGAALWLLVVVPAGLLILPHWPELSNNFTDRVLSLDNLLLLYFVFPILKICHEMGHATAVKAGGGEVHDLGLIVLVMLPVPYVDASASTIFQCKYQRAMVGAAGVAVELFIASVAFYLWLLAEPGAVRAVLYNVMVIAGVSTLIFNGNPLLRYDAYYILADLIEMPNLANRSLRYWSYLIERYLLGARQLTAPDATRTEKVWLVAYGAASSVYRVLVTVVIALFIAGRFFFIGVVLAGWAVVVMAVLPVVKAIRHLLGSPRLHGHRSRAIMMTFGLVGGVFSLLLLVPVPYHTHAEGVVWLPEEALLRAGGNGFLAEFLVQSGAFVRTGDPVLRCVDPELDAKLRSSRARVLEWEATYASEIVTDRIKAEVSRQKLLAAKDELATTQQREADLMVRAQTDGTLIVPQIADLPGRFYRKGDLLAYVIGRSEPVARVVVSQDAVDQVRVGTDRIRVMMVGHPELVMPGRTLRAVPSGVDLLPSRALALDGGGEIATDPRETKGAKAMQRMFQFDVALDMAGSINQFGQRVYVRFEHEAEPLLQQWYRSVRLLFLSRFSV